MGRRWLVVCAAMLVACAPKRVREQPILENGDRVESADAAVAAAREATERDRLDASARRDSLAAAALDGCSPAICEAIARGEVTFGMTEAQVLAATRSTAEAWTTRRSGAAVVMVPRDRGLAPRDAVGELAMIQIRDGRVGSYSFQEAHGVRVVSAPADATTAARARALGEMLIREGDDLAARGDLASALDRYDRAQVLRPGDAELDYRIATVLDKQLRPIEALVRYQLFLHRLEIERIDAIGEANAKLADAIARARERIIVLERNGR